MQLNVKIALAAILSIIAVEVHGSRTYHNRPWYPHRRDHYRFENLGRHGPHGRYGPYSEHRFHSKQHHRRPYYEDFRPPWLNSEESSESDSKFDSGSYEDSYGSSEEYTWYNYGHRHRWRYPPRVTNAPRSDSPSSRTSTKKVPSNSRWHSNPSRRPSISEHRTREGTKITAPRPTSVLSKGTTRQRTHPSEEVFFRETAATKHRPTPKTKPPPKPHVPYNDDYEDYDDNDGGRDSDDDDNDGGRDSDDDDNDGGRDSDDDDNDGGRDSDDDENDSSSSYGDDHNKSSENSGGDDLSLSPLPLLLPLDSSRGSGGKINDFSRKSKEKHISKNEPETNLFTKSAIKPTNTPEIDPTTETERKPINTLENNSSDSSSLKSNTISQTVVYCLDNCVTIGDFNPVCGTNGESYYNFGQLFCVKSCGINVEILRPGRCEPLSPLPEDHDTSNGGRDNDDDVNDSIQSSDGDLINNSERNNENRNTKNIPKTNLITKPVTDSTSIPEIKPTVGMKTITTTTIEKNPSSESLPESNAISQAVLLCLENCVATGEINPVCGTNGESYDNYSQLFCVKSCGIHVELQRVGRCLPLSSLPDDYEDASHKNNSGMVNGSVEISSDDRDDSNRGSDSDDNDSSGSNDGNDNDNSSGNNELSFPRLHLLSPLDDSRINSSDSNSSRNTETNDNHSRNTPIINVTTEAGIIIPSTETSATTPEINLATTTETASITSSSPNPNFVSQEVIDCIDNCVATSEYNPVCGTNGQDFDNHGQLLCVKSCGINIELARVGRCSPRRHFPDDYYAAGEDDDDDDDDDYDDDDDDDNDNDSSKNSSENHNDSNEGSSDDNVDSSTSNGINQVDTSTDNLIDYSNSSKNGTDNSSRGDGDENVGKSDDPGDEVVTTVTLPPSPTTRSSNLRRTTALTSFHLCMRLCPIKITYSPICGTDFVTYINVDRMQCARGCGKDVQILCSQPCGVCNLKVRPLSSSATLLTTPMPSTIGSMKQCVEACPVIPEYRPVCGTNKVTYRNAVQLLCVQMCGDDVKAMHFGQCPLNILTEAPVVPVLTTVSSITSTAAPMVITESPIGTTEEDDDITLPPEVIECVRNCPVTAEYDPVCGTNDVTYVNPGRLECAKYCTIEVEFSYKGLCSGFFSSWGGRATQSWEILRNSTTVNPLITTMTSAQTTTSWGVPTTRSTTSASSTMFSSKTTTTTAVTGVPIQITEAPFKTTEEDYDDITLPPEVIECVRHCPVTSEYDPVCGTNEVTYVNRGRLECAKYCQIEVEMGYKGLCNGFFSSAGGRATESWEILRNATTRSPLPTLTLSSAETSPTAIPSLKIKSSSPPTTLTRISLLPLIYSSNTSSISSSNDSIATTRIDRSKLTLSTATESTTMRNFTINRDVLVSIFGESSNKTYTTNGSEVDNYSLDPKYGKENETSTDYKEIVDPDRIIFRD